MRVLREEGHGLGRLLECAGMARSSYYYALSHPKAPTRPELWEAAAEIFSRTANGCGHRQIAMCLRAERGRARIAYKTVLKMMREMGISCGIRRETDYHRYNSYRGKVGKTFENVIGRDFAADGPWEKMGTDVTEFKQPWGKALLRAGLRLRQQGDRRLVHVAAPQHGPAARAARPARVQEAQGLQADPALGHGLAVPAGRLVQAVGGGRRGAEHVPEGHHIDNGATEQVFGHIKDEFFRGRTWPDFESFKADLDDFVVHWNTRRRQVKLKGLTPEEFRRQSLAA